MVTKTELIAHIVKLYAAADAIVKRGPVRPNRQTSAAIARAAQVARRNLTGSRETLVMYQLCDVVDTLDYYVTNVTDAAHADAVIEDFLRRADVFYTVPRMTTFETAPAVHYVH